MTFATLVRGSEVRRDLVELKLASKMGDGSKNLAVLLDADNVSYKVVAGLMAEVASYCNAGVRPIYGDWTSPHR